MKEIINKVIRERRSIYPHQFTGEKISDTTVIELLENAGWAPNHGQTQPWKFLVFKEEKLTELGVFLAELYKEITPKETFNKLKYEKLPDRMLTTSHVIGIVMEKGDNPKIPEIEEIEAVACAMQNFALSATAYGLGGYWSSGALAYASQTKEHFQLGEKDLFLGFFFLGVPKKDLKVEGRRKPISDKITWM